MVFEDEYCDVFVDQELKGVALTHLMVTLQESVDATGFLSDSTRV